MDAINDVIERLRLEQAICAGVGAAGTAKGIEEVIELLAASRGTPVAVRSRAEKTIDFAFPDCKFSVAISVSLINYEGAEDETVDGFCGGAVRLLESMISGMAAHAKRATASDSEPVVQRGEGYDGETPCPVCGVIICAYCQGMDPEHCTTKQHAKTCVVWNG